MKDVSHSVHPSSFILHPFLHPFGMRDIGKLCLLVALVCSGYGAFVCLAYRVRAHPFLKRASIACGIATLIAVTGAMAILARALLAKDFQYEYVADYTSKWLPWHYSLAALWAGQAGSLLLWTWLLCLVTLLFRILPTRDGWLARLRVWRSPGQRLVPDRHSDLRRRPVQTQPGDASAGAWFGAAAATPRDADSSAGDLSRLCTMVGSVCPGGSRTASQGGPLTPTPLPRCGGEGQG